MSASQKNKWFQSWPDDWAVMENAPLAALGLLGRMERLAVNGRPYGHVTWQNGESIDVDGLATLSNEAPEQIAEYVRLMERRGVIGMSKAGAYTVLYLLSRAETSKKRAKTGKNGGDVTQRKIKEKNGLLKQVPEQVPKPINDKLKTIKKEKQEKEKSPMWFEGELIRLNRSDYESWLKIYGGSDDAFMKWLWNRDQWFVKEAAPEAKKNWFISTSRALEGLRQ